MTHQLFLFSFSFSFSSAHRGEPSGCQIFSSLSTQGIPSKTKAPNNTDNPSPRRNSSRTDSEKKDKRQDSNTLPRDALGK